MFGTDVRAWFPVFQARIRHLAGLADGWDGEGSPPVDPAILSSAESLVRRLLPDWSGSHEPLDCYADIPVPFASPISGGTLQLEWRSDRRYLEMEFLDKDTVAFLFRENGRLENGRMGVQSTADIRRLLDRFAAP